jgi:hypothetical protein
MDQITKALLLAKDCTYADLMTDGAKEFLRAEIDKALEIKKTNPDGAEEYYEKMRILGLTDDITGNPDPNYRESFYQAIFRLMEGFCEQGVRAAREADIKDMHVLKNHLMTRQLNPVKYCNMASGVEKGIALVKSKL